MRDFLHRQRFLIFFALLAAVLSAIYFFVIPTMRPTRAVELLAKFVQVAAWLALMQVVVIITMKHLAISIVFWTTVIGAYALSWAPHFWWLPPDHWIVAWAAFYPTYVTTLPMLGLLLVRFMNSALYEHMVEYNLGYRYHR